LIKKKIKIVMAAIWNIIPLTIILILDLDCFRGLAAIAVKAMLLLTAWIIRERTLQEQKI